MQAYKDETKYRIEHAGRVGLGVSQTTAGFLFGIATIVAAGRVAVRLTIRRRLYLDDFVLLFGLACLVAGTAVYYNFMWYIYVLNILKYDPRVFPTIADLQKIMNGQPTLYSLTALMWTAIISAKLCFLVAFRALIKNVSRSITIWYWVTFSFTIAVWCLMFSLPWIECPYSGEELLAHCTPETPRDKTIAGQWLAFTTDAITDAMIVSIPIYILRHVRMRFSQKLAIASFLCLSIVMIITALIRLCLSSYKGKGELTLQYLLLHVEACTAITMAALAAYRTVFVEKNKYRDIEGQAAPRPQHVDPRNMQLAHIPTDTVRGHIQKMRGPHENSDVYLSQPDTGGSKLNTLRSFVRGAGSTGTTRTYDSGATSDLDSFSSDPTLRNDRI